MISFLQGVFAVVELGDLAQKERLRALAAWRYYRRQILCISTRKLAAVLGVSRGRVERWEEMNSDRLPDIGDILALSKAMHMDPIDVFKWIMTADRFVEMHRSKPHGI